MRSCLESVKWADEIVIVDMNSEDETVNIAREYTDKVFMHERVGYCEPARKFAAEKTTGDWILNIDADEMVTAGLKVELLKIIAEGKYNAAYVPRKNYFWGEEMRYSNCGIFQDRPLRFYKKEAVQFSDVIHAGIQLTPSANAYKIDNPNAILLHFSYGSVAQYWEKMDRYTRIEAEALFNSGKTYTFKEMLNDAVKAFWKRYFKKGQGRKDGEWGWIYCIWTAVYKINTYAQYKLMKTYNALDYAPHIEKKYDAIVQSTLKELSSPNP